MFVKEVLGEWHRGRGGRIGRLTPGLSGASLRAHVAALCQAISMNCNLAPLRFECFQRLFALIRPIEVNTTANIHNTGPSVPGHSGK